MSRSGIAPHSGFLQPQISMGLLSAAQAEEGRDLAGKSSCLLAVELAQRRTRLYSDRRSRGSPLVDMVEMSCVGVDRPIRLGAPGLLEESHPPPIF
jgi:hypothetical protein